MEEISTIAPNREYLYMTFCKSSSTKGKNEEIVMEKLDDKTQAKILKLAQIGGIKESFLDIKQMLESNRGIFKEKRGPVNNKINTRVSYHSMDEWDATYEKYKRMGAEIQETEKKLTKKVSKNPNSDNYAPLEDKEVDDFIKFLRSYTEKTLKENFTISVSDISDSRIVAAEKILKQLVEAVNDFKAGKTGMSVPMFNSLRHRLHQKLPRVIANVRKDDVKSKAEYEAKVKEEIEFYDFFKDQVDLYRSPEKSVSKNILDTYDIQMSLVSDKDEIENIKKMLGRNRSQFLRAFRVVNNKTEKYFDNYCNKKGLTLSAGITRLFHGSGTENWWSIITNGLYLRPESFGINICGKAFGHGIYFAPLAQKSIGYTSLGGSYWKKGEDPKAYLAIFKVATGEIYDIYGEGKGVPDNYKQLQDKHPGADCTWAFSRSKNSSSYLQNEEVIVYTDGSIKKDGPEEKKVSQCTIEYLIEVNLNNGTLW